MEIEESQPERRWSRVAVWVGLALIVFLRGVISVLYAWGDYLRKATAEIAEVPSLQPIYAAHIFSLITKSRKFGPKHQLKPITLTVTKGHLPSKQQLVDFQRLCQPGSSKAPVKLPLLFLTVQTFALQLACLANDHYPLSAIGSVLTGYRALQLREHDTSRPLLFRIHLSKSFRLTAAGNVEFETTCSARDAEEGHLVWTDVTTFMAKVAKPPPTDVTGSKTEDPDTSNWQHHADWKWSIKAGPDFARQNGDVNPIHMRPLFAKLFGFRSNIAHGQHVVARAVNAIEQQGPQSLEYPRAVSASFRRPTILPTYVRCSWQDQKSEETLVFGEEGATLRCSLPQPTSFAVTMQASGKALVVGCLGQAIVQ